ncbi:PucR family transcriptional regulator [Selenomonas ruminantium]|uniref:PucR family transcriptional regulator n=1 Tax=Selenomonas ruminantium TaxID=971 RepID=UPI00040B3192|nr:helix-turn-helix domain-containing protein [Selenomonas ruminantium]
MEKERVELWQAEDIAGKLAVVHNYTGLELVVLDNLGDLRGKTAGFREEDYSLLRRNQQALQKNDLVFFENLTIIPLKQERQLRGWLAADRPADTMTEEADCLFRELSMQLTFLLWHEEEIRSIERKHREQFLYDILYHNFSSSEEVIRMGRFWNMRLEKPHHVVVVEFDQHIDVDKHAQLLAELDREWMRVLSARFVQPILMLLNMQLIILFEDDREPARSQGELAAIMADAMAKVKEDFPTILPFSIGIGRLHYSVSEICRSFQEARQALSLGRFRQPENGITCYEDLGVLKLLSHIRTEELDDFAQETLEALIAYDSHNDTDLLRTLEIYFQENESLSLAAEKLFIHANTLRNRLKKIESILGVELNQADVRVRFYVACQALRITRQIM